nr:MAG TPA: hypothetical protein [Caudoviricetes sp.]
MLKLKKTEVVGWEAAIRGMRNPMNSWDQSDSHYESEALECHDLSGDPTKVYLADKYVLGSNDLDLIMRLRAAGIDHRKFMRMIEVYVDITAPLYWWKEFDTYKVGTVANSCSTMHKIAAKEFTLEDFSHEHLFDFCPNCDTDSETVLQYTIKWLNYCREKYLETKDKNYWWQMIQLLPTSYNQKRTIMLSYEVLANIYKSRRNHKLDEWHTLCDWIEGLPYSEMITGGAASLNKKITLPEADAIAACTLSKLQKSGDSPDKSKAILMEFYEKMRKSDASTPPNDFKIVDEWNQYGRVDYCIQSVKSNCEVVTDTIGKLKKKFWSQEKGDISDAKPE